MLLNAFHEDLRVWSWIGARFGCKVRKMKILMLSNGWTTEISGGEEHMFKVTKHWGKENSVDFLLPSLGYNYCKELLTGGAFVYNTLLEKYVKNGALKVILLYFLRMVRTLLFNPKTCFDVLVASSHFPHDVIPALFLRLRNPKSKVVVYFHGVSIPPQHGTILRTLSIMYTYLGMLLAARLADLIFVINKHTKELLLRFGVKESKVVLTTNGVDIDLVFRKGQKYYDACFLGRLVRSKGIFDLIAVWERICEKRPHAKLAVIGDGPELESMKMYVKKKRLENNVVFLGVLFGRDKHKALYSSRIFLFPSHLESWGIAIAEAMACNLPVVAYDLPVYKEVFEDKLITVPAGDLDAIAENVTFLLQNPDIARRIGDDCRELVKRYSWSVVANKELSVILALVNGMFKN